MSVQVGGELATHFGVRCKRGGRGYFQTSSSSFLGAIGTLLGVDMLRQEVARLDCDVLNGGVSLASRVAQLVRFMGARERRILGGSRSISDIRRLVIADVYP